jgi:N-carbamoyl-L-amino-acid hydrolase
MHSNLTINAQRLWDTLEETARFGGTAKGGIRRLTLSPEDKQVRDWFRAQAEALGCLVHVDALGSMFAIRPGRDATRAPIGLGSHLDTQPTGGKYDGVLGVLAALEALRTLVEAGYETAAPIAVVNWTNEEGSRFSPAMLCSGVYAGAFTTDHALAQKDSDGTSFAEALSSIGYRGALPVGEPRLGAFFELHIEQGPILEAEAKTIGVVTGVQGMRWYDVTMTGQDAHTGATPMGLRRNALVGAARFIAAVDAIGQAHLPGVATVGSLEVRPNSRNVVPGEVALTVDLRHPDDAVLDAMEAAMRAALREAAAGLGVELTRIWNQPAVCFDAAMIESVRAAAARGGYSSRDLVSGAGHDAAYLSRVMPATMIFVPCAGGLSHNEAEAITFTDAAAGAQVLLDAVLDYDRRLG